MMIDSGGTPAVVAGKDSNRFLRHPPPTPHTDSEISLALVGFNNVNYFECYITNTAFLNLYQPILLRRA